MSTDTRTAPDRGGWGFHPESDLAHCLLPTLDALGWRGTQGQLFEVLPHEPDNMGFADFMNVMASLMFESRSMETRLNHIDARLLPCLFVPDNEPAKVLLKSSNQGFLVYGGATGAFNQIPKSSLQGTAVFFRAISSEKSSPLTRQKDWFLLVLGRFKQIFLIVLFICFLLSLIALVSPIFVMTIYDQVLPGRSSESLYLFVAGAGIFFLAESLFRFLRTRLLGFASVRLSHIAGTELLRRILYLPAAFTESASLGSQVSRIRDFETVRDFFSGPAIVALMELPFVTLLLLGMVILAGPVAYVPLVAILLFVLFGILIFPMTQRSNSLASEAVSKKRQFLVEMLSNFRAIKYTGSRRHWIEHYGELSAEASMATFHAGNVAALVNTLSQALVTAAGLATVVAGVLHVLAGNMSSGALMACMLLVWRILAPLRTGFGVITQVGKIQKSVLQIDRLMNMRLEKNLEAETSLSRRFNGHVTFSQVSLRYSSDAYPALLGVSFKVPNGGTLLIVGHDGSGKSTILKLILGMYHPQAGKVLIDHQNVQQIDPHLLRRNIGYSAQGDTFLYGRISQNLRFADPSASDRQLEQAAMKAGVLEEILALPDGFETRIGDHNIAQLSASFKKRLSLARALVKENRLLLFDEPERGLTPVQENHFLASLKEMKGESTVVIASPRTRYFQVADAILWMDNGRIKAFGPKVEVIPMYLKAMSGT